MSTLTVVQKDGFAAIASDQMTIIEGCKCPGGYKSHPSKIVQVGDSFIGVAGSTAHVRVMESLARNHAEEFDLSSIDRIFETFRRLHKILVDDYYLLTRDEQDEEQPYESSRWNILIANASGIYEVEACREVIKYERFWATGSGWEFALGAMEALYVRDNLSAKELAEKGVEVGCLFDKSSGLPIGSYTIELLNLGG